MLGRSRVINAGSGARRSCEGERLLESVRNSEFSDNLYAGTNRTLPSYRFGTPLFGAQIFDTKSAIAETGSATFVTPEARRTPDVPN